MLPPSMVGGCTTILTSTVLRNIPGVLAEVAVEAIDLNGVADVVIVVERSAVVTFSVKTERHAIDYKYWLESLMCYIRLVCCVRSHYLSLSSTQ